jgi:UDP-N-acetylglucosamine 2-epimerase (non-hydrolysing)
MAPKVLVIFGTRPEAIKLCPVVMHIARHCPGWNVRTCVTAQHRELLNQAIQVFGVEPDYDLNAMAPGQTLFQSTSRILASLESVLAAERPDMLMVQGDTTTTLCGALAGFYARIPVAHVEAGLRTWDPDQPFPEEINRVLVSRMAALHLAATEWAAENLRKEGVPGSSIAITGNPGIDAVLYVRDGLRQGTLRGAVATDPGRRLILVTAHRRESFGGGLEQICDALADLAQRENVQIVYPVHPNPSVRGPVCRRLGACGNIALVEPLDYVSFVDLMERAAVILTDSGGVQEEAPSLGKPVLIMRDKTERPEAVAAGTARLVGTRRKQIVEECMKLLDDRGAYECMTGVPNPYGDGHASERIAAAAGSFLAGAAAGVGIP